MLRQNQALLPEGWWTAQAPSGRTYYYHTDNKQWTFIGARAFGCGALLIWIAVKLYCIALVEVGIRVAET